MRRPTTFLLTLPSGEKVRCWRRDAEAIRMDVLLRGNVLLRRAEGSEVYDRLDPASVEGVGLAPTARRV